MISAVWYRLYLSLRKHLTVFQEALELKYTASVLKYYIDYIEQAAIDRKYEESKNAVVPNINNGVSIEFKNVSFKYPNTDVYILKT